MEKLRPRDYLLMHGLLFEEDIDSLSLAGPKIKLVNELKRFAHSIQHVEW